MDMKEAGNKQKKAIAVLNLEPTLPIIPLSQ